MSKLPTLKPTLKKPGPLTAAIIADMAPGEDRGDTQVAGLRVRSSATGKKVFFYRYRSRDRALREIILGDVGPLTLAKARDAALKKRLERQQGKDPQLEKRKAREEAMRKRAAEREREYTAGDLVEEYIKEALSKQKRGAESARLLRRDFVPLFGTKSASELTRRELQDELIRPTLLKHPRKATQLLSRIRCAYVHAVEQGRLPDSFNSPTLGIKGASQVRRKRALTDAELASFLRWLPHSPYSRIIRESLLLVLLTGCRSGEVIAARWRDIDLERGVWTMRETKNGEPHDAMLPEQAVELLKYRQGIDKTFVFPSRIAGQHVAQKALGLAQYTARHMEPNSGNKDPIEVPWTVHDLRRTVATGLARLGCPRVVQDRILNHVDNSVSAIYDRHSYDAEARSWLQKWADHMDALKSRNVVPISAAKAA
ncbi:MAG TPA: tyrosine-type recombinase/integrase [Burkholderiales bacterium]|nr:tyrosine-type recombinase/integrase [Burkholderiales bacterium]